MRHCRKQSSRHCRAVARSGAAKLPGYTHTRDRGVGDRGKASLARHIVDDVENPEAPPFVGELPPARARGAISSGRRRQRIVLRSAAPRGVEGPDAGSSGAAPADARQLLAWRRPLPFFCQKLAKGRGHPAPHPASSRFSFLFSSLECLPGRRASRHVEATAKPVAFQLYRSCYPISRACGPGPPAFAPASCSLQEHQ